MEVILPASSSPSTLRKCPKCGKKSLKRDIMANARTVVVGDAIIGYSNRFPYVSRSLPFKGELAGEGRHVGKNDMIEVQSKKHEDNLRAVHGYVGESKVVSNPHHGTGG